MRREAHWSPLLISLFVLSYVAVLHMLISICTIIFTYRSLSHTTAICRRKRSVCLIVIFIATRQQLANAW